MRAAPASEAPGAPERRGAGAGARSGCRPASTETQAGGARRGADSALGACRPAKAGRRMLQQAAKTASTIPLGNHTGSGLATHAGSEAPRKRSGIVLICWQTNCWQRFAEPTELRPGVPPKL